MKILFCKCKQCKRGRYASKWLFVAKVRSGRRRVRELIRRGDESLPERVYVGYVD